MIIGFERDFSKLMSLRYYKLNYLETPLHNQFKYQTIYNLISYLLVLTAINMHNLQGNIVSISPEATSVIRNLPKPYEPLFLQTTRLLAVERAFLTWLKL